MRNRLFVASKLRKPRRRGTARLFAVSAAVLASGSAGTPAAAAATAGVSREASAAEQGPRLLAFDIKPAMIDGVIADFRRVTGINVVLTDAGLGMIQSPGVVGTLTAEQAMERLLMGTSIKATFSFDGVTLSVLG